MKVSSMAFASMLIMGSAAIGDTAPVRKVASPFDGEWRIEYPCAKATGIYADRCAAGQRDFLEFQLSAHGDRLCGTAAATAQLGNHADDGTEVSGTIHGNVAQVKWDILDSHGDGMMTVQGRTLVFRRGPWMADDGALWSFPPAETTILRRNGDADPKLAVCGSVASNAEN